MKTLLVAALVLVPCLALADATNAPSTPPAAEQPATPPELAGLTPANQKLAEQFLAAEAKQKKKIEDNKALSEQQKEVQISNLHRDTLVQIQALKMSQPAAAHP